MVTADDGIKGAEGATASTSNNAMTSFRIVEVGFQSFVLIVTIPIVRYPVGP
jgi:hypothetical protein